MQISYVESAEQLNAVLALCCSILGQHISEIENYRYEDWERRISANSRLLLFAHEGDQVIAAVLGRPESEDSLVMGFAACDAAFRKRGITKRLVAQFEANARMMRFKYITLGADGVAPLAAPDEPSEVLEIESTSPPLGGTDAKANPATGDRNRVDGIRNAVLIAVLGLIIAVVAAASKRKPHAKRR